MWVYGLLFYVVCILILHVFFYSFILLEGIVEMKSYLTFILVKAVHLPLHCPKILYFITTSSKQHMCVGTFAVHLLQQNILHLFDIADMPPPCI